jgi:hypothetical protein
MPESGAGTDPSLMLRRCEKCARKSTISKHLVVLRTANCKITNLVYSSVPCLAVPGAALLTFSLGVFFLTSLVFLTASFAQYFSNSRLFLFFIETASHIWPAEIERPVSDDHSPKIGSVLTGFYLYLLRSCCYLVNDRSTKERFCPGRKTSSLENNPAAPAGRTHKEHEECAYLVRKRQITKMTRP